MTDDEVVSEDHPQMASLISKLHKPVLIELDSIGPVAFGPINLKKFFQLPELLAIEDDRDFAIEFTYQLLTTPDITIENWRGLSEAELVDVVKTLCINHRGIAKYYSSDSSSDPFTAFRAAINSHSRTVNEMWSQIHIDAPTFQNCLNHLEPTLLSLSANSAIQSALDTLSPGNIQGNTGLFSQMSQLAQMSQLQAIDIDPIRIAIEEAQRNSLEIQKEVLSAFDGITTQWMTALPEIFSRLNESYLKLDLNLLPFNTSLTEINDILKKYHWFIAPSMSESLSLARTVKEIHYSGSHQRKKMNQLFIQYISENDYQNLKIMMAAWKENSLFAPRMAIIKSALAVLRATPRSYNPSNVVVPTLITQIDGIIYDFVIDRGISPVKGQFYDSNNKRSNPENILKNLILIQDVGGDVEQAISKLLGYGIEADTFLLLDVLFQKSLRGQSLNRPTSFSRHKILHGEFTRYGRMENTVRAFMILDYLAYLDSKIPRVSD
ncbi:hypothetical protein [Methanosphaerula subterraneus]|uniref:hypothetical protein n=1 Tax=Methanosphaerula subterraneus TaxID=3350244 RepID=UPI003F86A413